MWRQDVFKELLTLAWPAILQGLLLTVVFLTDRALLGHFSADGLGVMQICGPGMWSLFSLCGSIDVGALAMMGRAKGRGDLDELRALIRHCSLLVVTLGIGMTLLYPWIREGLIGWMGRETPELHQYARNYLYPLFLCAPFKMLGGLFFAALQSQSDTKTPMWISGICGFVNLGISAALIYGECGLPQLGIAGAAWGTAIAFSLQAILGGWRLTRLLPGVFAWRELQFRYVTLKPVLKISRGVFAERLGYHSAFLIFSSLVAGLGKVEMGAHQVILAVESIGFIGAEAFGIASSALIAQSIGREDDLRGEAVGWHSAALGAVMLLPLSALFLLCPKELISMISSDPRVILVGGPCLMVAAIAQPLMAISSALAGALRGAGETRSPLIASLIGPTALRLSACWGFAYYLEWGLFGIWLGSTIDWLGRSAYLAWAFKGGRWRHVKF